MNMKTTKFLAVLAVLVMAFAVVAIANDSNVDTDAGSATIENVYSDEEGKTLLKESELTVTENDIWYVKETASISKTITVAQGKTLTIDVVANEAADSLSIEDAEINGSVIISKGVSLTITGTVTNNGTITNNAAGSEEEKGLQKDSAITIDGADAKIVSGSGYSGKINGTCYPAVFVKDGTLDGQTLYSTTVTENIREQIVCTGSEGDSSASKTIKITNNTFNMAETGHAIDVSALAYSDTTISGNTFSSAKNVEQLILIYFYDNAKVDISGNTASVAGYVADTDAAVAVNVNGTSASIIRTGSPEVGQIKIGTEMKSFKIVSDNIIMKENATFDKIVVNDKCKLAIGSGVSIDANVILRGTSTTASIELAANAAKFDGEVYVADGDFIAEALGSTDLNITSGTQKATIAYSAAYTLTGEIATSTISGPISVPAEGLTLKSGTLTVDAQIVLNGALTVSEDTTVDVNAGISGNGGITNDGIINFASADLYYVAGTITGEGTIQIDGEDKSVTVDSTHTEFSETEFTTDVVVATAKVTKATIPAGKTLVINDADAGLDVTVTAAGSLAVINVPETATWDVKVTNAEMSIELKDVAGVISVSPGSIIVMVDPWTSGDIEAGDGDVVKLKGTIDGNVRIVGPSTGTATVLVESGETLTVTETSKLKLIGNVKMNNDGSIVGRGTIEVTEKATFYTFTTVSVYLTGNGTIITEDSMEDVEISGYLTSSMKATPTQRVIVTGNLTIRAGEYLVITGELVVPEGVTVSIEEGGLLMLTDPTAHATISGTIKASG
ncbi:MAG: hypothetical protein IKQ93_04525, partial [Candidatus Methanomethylophilaceae archaeon]|nr:hypothetical protein [Candidatus Methanomethylophilaceae archaeon]